MDLDEDSDIAIFQSYNPPSKSEIPPSIDLSCIEDFHDSVPAVNGGSITHYPLWTVGYSGRNKNLKNTQNWEELQGAEVIRKFMSTRDVEGIRDPKLFDYYLWNYREVLRILEDKEGRKWGHISNQLSKEAWNSYLPVFEDMFHADHRALAVGHYVAMAVDKENSSERPTMRTCKMLHDISGFHQNSGGMLCHFGKGKISSPEVIGMCKKLRLYPLFSS